MDKLLRAEISEYLEKQYAPQVVFYECKRTDKEHREKSESMCKAPKFSKAASYESLCLSLDLEDTFSEKLLKLIDKTGLSDPDIYKKAGIDRKLFSKIRSSKNYQPSKSTVLSFSIGLNLGLDDTLDLLKSAGYTLSNSSKFDLIIKYFIEQKIFDLFQINDALHEFDQPVLSF